MITILIMIFGGLLLISSLILLIPVTICAVLATVKSRGETYMAIPVVMLIGLGAFLLGASLFASVERLFSVRANGGIIWIGW